MKMRELIVQILLFPIMPTLNKGGGSVGETVDQVAAKQVAVDEYNNYMKEFRPFESKFIERTMAPTIAKENRAAGEVNADFQHKMAINPGMDPNVVLRNPDAFSKKAAIGASGINAAQEKVKESQIQGEQAISDLGLGKESSANLSFQGLAGSSLDRAISDKEAEVRRDNMITNSVMGAIGMGAGALKGTGGVTNINSPTTVSGPYTIGAREQTVIGGTNGQLTVR